jgi:hypothetical protein
MEGYNGSDTRSHRGGADGSLWERYIEISRVSLGNGARKLGVLEDTTGVLV